MDKSFETDEGETNQKYFEVYREKYERELESETPNQDIIYTFGLECLKQKDFDTKDEGISILEDLAEEGYKTEECLVAIAKCYRVQGKLHKARKLCEEILIRNPFNSQAKKLYDEMEHFVNTKGIIGLGIIFVAAICCFKIMRRMGK